MDVTKTVRRRGVLHHHDASPSGSDVQTIGGKRVVRLPVDHHLTGELAAGRHAVGDDADLADEAVIHLADSRPICARWRLPRRRRTGSPSNGTCAGHPRCAATSSVTVPLSRSYNTTLRVEAYTSRRPKK